MCKQIRINQLFGGGFKMNDVRYLDLPFCGSEMETSIKTARTKEPLRYRLGYTQGAIDFHIKEQNPKQVDFFQSAANLINKRLKLKSIPER